MNCWNFIKRWYKDHPGGCRYRQLVKLTMFKRKKDFPKLRGKSAEIKGVAGAVLALWEKHMNNKLGLRKKVRSLLTYDLEMNTILDAYKPLDGYMCLPQEKLGCGYRFMF